MKTSRRQQEEFLAMLRQCEGTLVRICCTFTDRRPDHMADLYQDIVYQLWRHWSAFRHESATNTWVTSVALSIACNLHRRRHELPFIILNEELCHHLADEADNDLYDLLYHLIDLLSDEDRQLIFLYLDRYRLRDIAAMLGISEDAVKKRIQRIKQRLIQLKKQEYE